ncbi:MAG: VacJ family lipoprotein [Myxococcota bacterium]|nr:VacJ family lipoprotein [Myxococcota bacterium]
MSRASGWLFALALACLGAGPMWATAARAEDPVPDTAAASSDAAAHHDELDFEEEYEEDVAQGDPLEPMNRQIFRLNEGLDRYAIEPVSKAWDYVLPDFVQHAIRNAFDNLRFPIDFANDVFQLDMTQAGVCLARFLLNSTVGIAGLMDPASTLGLHRKPEDFGQTLGFWGVPPGPYLMLPFFGPSNLRDGFGLIVDTGLRAIGFFIPLAVSFGLAGADALNRRSLIRDQLDTERRASLDWYVSVRNAYSQYRANLIDDDKDALKDYDYFPGLEIDADRPAQD